MLGLPLLPQSGSPCAVYSVFMFATAGAFARLLHRRNLAAALASAR